MKVKMVRTVCALGLLLTWATTASAKDLMAVTVENASGSPVIVNNGQAVGTIQLFYTVDATQFALGEFASFDVSWLINQGVPATNYGTGFSFDLIQSQQGGNVDLVAAPSSFLLTSAGQSGSSRVTIFITYDKDGNPPPAADGTDLVGNLKLDAGSKVGTVTNIQVHIRLVHPTNCLKVYNFVTDQDFNLGILSTTNLNVPSRGANANKVMSSQPGQFSDNVLVANVCATGQSFDLEVELDPSFATNPRDNPGNAVVTYTHAGEFDTSNYAGLLATAGTSNAQNLCLQNVTLAGGTSLLMTVHSKVRNSWPLTSLPADGSFDFFASLHDANTACEGPLYDQAADNPATFTLPFTINGN